MTRDEIFEVVKRCTLEVLPHLPADAVTVEGSLTDLGANSMDRVEVVMMSLEALKLRVPPAELQGVRDLRGLVDLIQRRLEGG